MKRSLIYIAFATGWALIEMHLFIFNLAVAITRTAEFILGYSLVYFAFGFIPLWLTLRHHGKIIRKVKRK